MQRLRRDVVYLDADAEILSYPTLFTALPDSVDLAVHFLDWGKHYGHTHGKLELLTGTLFARFNDRVMGLLEEWDRACKKAGEEALEQDVLQGLLQTSPWKDAIQVHPLPAEYCSVVTYDGKIPGYVVDPVILHHQASRECRGAAQGKFS